VLLDCDADSGTVSVLLESGDTKDDLNLPKDTTGNLEEQGAELVKMYEDGKNILVTVLATMGQEKIVAVKETNN